MSKRMQILFAALGVAILVALIVLIASLQKLNRELDGSAQRERDEKALEELQKWNGENADILEEQQEEPTSIAEIDAENCRRAIEETLQISTDALIDEVQVSDEMMSAAKSSDAKLTGVYKVNNNNYAIKVSVSGSQGTMTIMVGFDTSGCISGVSVVSHSETSGIGTKVVGNESASNGIGALDQYRGKGVGDYPLELGKDVDVISGATVTSKAVKNGVNAALAVYELLK